MNSIINRISERMKNKVHMIKVDSLVFDKDFQSLYPQEPEKVESIAQNMKVNGYDFSFPIIVLAKDHKTVLDGHSRVLATRIAGISVVPVIEKDFETKDQALLFMESLQLGRRNLSEADKMKHFQHMKMLKEKLKSEGKDVSAYTDEKLASQLQVSVRQIQKYNEVESKATAEQLEAIRKGEKSVNQVHTEIKQTQGITRKSPILLQNAMDQVLSVAKSKLDENQFTEFSKLLELISGN